MITADQPPLPMTMPSSGHANREAQFGAAAKVLGWHGIIVPDLRVFGERVTVVVELDEKVHAERVTSGWAPVTDRTAVAMWSWPEHANTRPAPAVRVVGTIAAGKKWQSSVRNAAQFGGFGSTALITESARTPTEQCRLTAQLHGVGVVWRCGDGDLRLVTPGRTGPVETARPTVVSRWFQEVLYDCVLKAGVIADQPVS